MVAPPYSPHAGHPLGLHSQHGSSPSYLDNSPILLKPSQSQLLLTSCICSATPFVPVWTDTLFSQCPHPPPLPHPICTQEADCLAFWHCHCAPCMHYHTLHSTPFSYAPPSWYISLLSSGQDPNSEHTCVAYLPAHPPPPQRCLPHPPHTPHAYMTAFPFPVDSVPFFDILLSRGLSLSVHFSVPDLDTCMDRGATGQVPQLRHRLLPPHTHHLCMPLLLSTSPGSHWTVASSHHTRITPPPTTPHLGITTHTVTVPWAYLYLGTAVQRRRAAAPATTTGRRTFPHTPRPRPACHLPAHPTPTPCLCPTCPFEHGCSSGLNLLDGTVSAVFLEDMGDWF